MRNELNEQKSALYNIEILYKARNNAIKLLYDCSLLISKGKYKATHGEWMKMLTPKQILKHSERNLSH